MIEKSNFIKRSMSRLITNILCKSMIENRYYLLLLVNLGANDKKSNLDVLLWRHQSKKKDSTKYLSNVDENGKTKLSHWNNNVSIRFWELAKFEFGQWILNDDEKPNFVWLFSWSTKMRHLRRVVSVWSSMLMSWKIVVESSLMRLNRFAYCDYWCQFDGNYGNMCSEIFRSLIIMKMKSAVRLSKFSSSCSKINFSIWLPRSRSVVHSLAEKNVNEMRRFLFKVLLSIQWNAETRLEWIKGTTISHRGYVKCT